MKKIILSDKNLTKNNFFNIYLDNDIIFFDLINKLNINIDRKYFFKIYQNYIGKLSKKYNSLEWWLLSISEKNIFVSKIYFNIAKFLYLKKIVKKLNKNIIIISKNIDFLDEFYKKTSKKEYIIYKNYKSNKRLKIIKNSILKSLSKLKNSYFEINYLKSIFSIIKNKNINKAYYTWIDKRSFNNKKFSDIFMKDFLKQEKNNFILFKIMNNNNAILSNIYSLKSNSTFLPIDIYINNKDFILVFILIIKSIFKFNFKNKILLAELYNSLSGNFIDTFFISKAIQNFIKNNKVKNLYYIFENLAWERGINYLLKNNETKKIGYQHSNIQLNLFNFFPSKYEKNIIPLPNKILVNGLEIKNILNKYGHYNTKIEVNFAYRYKYLKEYINNFNIKNNKIKTIGISLGGDIFSTILTKNYIKKYINDLKNYKIYIKRHPFFPFKTFENSNYKNIHIYDDYDLEGFLKECDIILYMNTTTSLEAVMQNRFIIYLDLDKYSNYDTFFNYKNNFILKENESPIKIINKINNMNEKEKKEYFIKFKNYIKTYFNLENYRIET